MSSTIDVTMENFESVIDSKEIVILDFWAEWCGPCKMLAPVFEEMATHNSDILFGKVNTEVATDLAQAFQVRSIPTIIAFKQGEIVFERSGLLHPNQWEELLEGLRSMKPIAEEEPRP